MVKAPEKNGKRRKNKERGKVKENEGGRFLTLFVKLQVSYTHCIVLLYTPKTIKLTVNIRLTLTKLECTEIVQK